MVRCVFTGCGQPVLASQPGRHVLVQHDPGKLWDNQGSGPTSIFAHIPILYHKLARNFRSAVALMAVVTLWPDGVRNLISCLASEKVGSPEGISPAGSCRTYLELSPHTALYVPCRSVRLPGPVVHPITD